MSRWPAVVTEYQNSPRRCLVDIPGITDGSSLPAEIEQSLGDRSEHTEIRILPGDRVWVDFLAGDQRYPIITGFRAKNRGNMLGTRHWEHENFTTNADETVLIKAGKSIRLEAGEKIELIVGGSTYTLTPDSIAAASAAHTIKGPVTQTGGDITSDGKSVQTHTHREQGDGQLVSPPL